MVFDTTTIIKRNVYRQATEPGNVKEGDLWIDTSGNNNEFNQYTGTTWELLIARGPDTPAYPVEGSLWRDTGAGSLKQYDGSAWQAIGQDSPPLYGDGSDGAISRAGNGNENGVIQATTYEIQNAVTMTVTSGILIVMATDSITITGTIDASGQGGAGSSGATPTNNAANGGNSELIPTSLGGAGGTNPGAFGNLDGGDGGDGDTGTILRQDYGVVSPGVLVDLLETGTGAAGAGGGGGGGGSGNTGSASPAAGTDGTAPGGGGGGGGSDATDTDSNSGGDGGNGGGFVLLIAPDITIGGTVDVSGADGLAGDGGNASGGGGGGGGGSGGMIVLAAQTLTENTPTYNVAAGAAGAAGSSTTAGADGGAGAAGAAGLTVKI